MVEYYTKNAVHTYVIEHKHFEFESHCKLFRVNIHRNIEQNNSFSLLNDERNKTMSIRYKSLPENGINIILVSSRLTVYKHYDMYKIINKIFQIKNF